MFCIYEPFEDYISKEYFGGAWKSHNLVPNGQVPIGFFGNLPNEVERPDYGIVSRNYDQLANLLEISNCFAA